MLTFVPNQTSDRVINEQQSDTKPPLGKASGIVSSQEEHVRKQQSKKTSYVYTLKSYIQPEKETEKERDSCLKP